MALGGVSEQFNQRIPKLIERKIGFLAVLPRHAGRGDANLVPAQADARPAGEAFEVVRTTGAHGFPTAVAREGDCDTATVSDLA